MIAASEIARLFRRNQTHLECGSHGTPQEVEVISLRFCSFLTPRS
jgi:hypothetical protein